MRDEGGRERGVEVRSNMFEGDVRLAGGRDELMRGVGQVLAAEHVLDGVEMGLPAGGARDGYRCKVVVVVVVTRRFEAGLWVDKGTVVAMLVDWVERLHGCG
jgi:hypothetical protein